MVTGTATRGQEICQNDLAKFGDQIEVVFCNNDDMAIGALQAIQAAGRTVNKDIYLVGVDALDAAKNEVANGNMTGTVLNDAKGQATQAVECMEELLGGKTFRLVSRVSTLTTSRLPLTTSRTSSNLTKASA